MAWLAVHHSIYAPTRASPTHYPIGKHSL